MNSTDCAEAGGLSYTNDAEPGFSRRKSGQSFSYIGATGRRIRDKRTITRIEKLAIPPAYTDVWINPNPLGHIQATGRDARGRKQYRYHPRWRNVRDETKYARMAAFGHALPSIRAQVEEDLNVRDLPKSKVIAAIVRLLEMTLIRVGNDAYAKSNKSFGLTTLRNRHVDLHGAEVIFEFKGKSGVHHKTRVHDKKLARIVRQCHETPGQRLFQYVDADGRRHDVESADVNAYLKAATGDDFTAKDFRTWAGTICAAKALALHAPAETENDMKAAITRCVKATAGLLGNTPAVCRAAYIHPEVLAAFQARRLPKGFAEAEEDACEAELLTFLGGLAKDVEGAKERSGGA